VNGGHFWPPTTYHRSCSLLFHFVRCRALSQQQQATRISHLWPCITALSQSTRVRCTVTSPSRQFSPCEWTELVCVYVCVQAFPGRMGCRMGIQPRESASRLLDAPGFWAAAPGAAGHLLQVSIPMQPALPCPPIAAVFCPARTAAVGARRQTHNPPPTRLLRAALELRCW
jgi:hypothetical protein